MSKVDQYWTHAECWRRRQSLCIGYDVNFDSETRTYRIDVFAIQNRRTPALLGTLQLREDEWDVFFRLVYKKWEDMSYPRPSDEEADTDERSESK